MRIKIRKKDPIKRFERGLERYHQKSGFQFPEATERYLKGTIDFFLFVEEKTREVLNERGISVIFAWAYYAFGRKVYKIIKKGKFWETPLIVEEWAGNKGLTKEVLWAITEALQNN
ncbi:MAG: hypothetical protein ABIK81_03620 [candidate division WOR-3 bacterium]